MSEQIREQISAFLDGELPSSEAELLLKRLAREPQLRETFGRLALMGEAIRGKQTYTLVTRGFAAQVNRAIEGESMLAVNLKMPQRRSWWRPLTGLAVAAGVAAVAVVGLQQRAYTPQVTRMPAPAPAPAPALAMVRPQVQSPARIVPQTPKSNGEALSYTVPVVKAETEMALPAARLTNYVFAHSKYSSPLGRGNVLSGLIAETADGPVPP